MNLGKTYFFIISAGILFFLGFEAGGFQISLLKMAEEFQLSGAESGFLVAIQYSAIILMPMLVGKIADFIGKRKILFSFCLVFSIGCIGVMFSSYFSILIIAVFIIGAGYSVCESMISAMMADSFGDKSGKYLNLAQCFFSLGAVISPQVLQLGRLLFDWEWRSLFFICMVSYLILAIGVLIYKENSISANKKRTHKQAQEKIITGKKKEKAGLVLLTINMFIYGGLEVGISYYLDTFISKELLHAAYSANVLSIFWLTMIPSRILGGMLYRYKNRITIWCYGISAVMLVIVSLADSFVTAAIVFAVLGICLGPIWSNLMSTAAERNINSAATATGILSAGCGCGSVIFPILLGMSVDGYGLRISFMMLAVMSMLGTLVCFVYRKLILEKQIENKEGL